MIAKTNFPFFCPWQISLLSDDTLFFLDASSELSVQSQDLPQHCPKKKKKLASEMKPIPHPWRETLSASRPGTHGSLEMVVFGLYISLNFYLCFVFINIIWLILPHALKLFKVLPSPESNSTPPIPAEACLDCFCVQ